MSEQIKGGGPAFPQFPIHGETFTSERGGMTLRQYAAIKLRVPESGDEWLDDMIRKSLRDEFAAKAMAALVMSGDEEAGDRIGDIPSYGYDIAHGMFLAREQQP